jgi:hypothetical protein
MADLIKVSILGTMPSGEVWSVNPVFRLNPPMIPTDVQMVNIAEAINLLTVPSGLKLTMSSGTIVTGCRVEARSAAGVLDKVAEGARSVPAVGTGASPHPFQSAIVLTLLSPTASARGRGRLYWPATGVALTASTLRIAGGDLSSIAVAAESYLVQIQSALSTVLSHDVALCVWSRVSSITHAVQKIRVGDVVDTQRRRRDSLVESKYLMDYSGA